MNYSWVYTVESLQDADPLLNKCIAIKSRVEQLICYAGEVQVKLFVIYCDSQAISEPFFILACILSFLWVHCLAFMIWLFFFLLL